MPTHYEILGVSSTATDNEIKSAYRKLVLKLHPDKNQGDNESTEKFNLVMNAFQVLREPDQRKKYDSEIQLKQRSKANSNMNNKFTSNGSSWKSNFGKSFPNQFKSYKNNTRRNDMSDAFGAFSNSAEDIFNSFEKMSGFYGNPNLNTFRMNFSSDSHRVYNDYFKKQNAFFDDTYKHFEATRQNQKHKASSNPVKTKSKEKVNDLKPKYEGESNRSGVSNNNDDNVDNDSNNKTRFSVHNQTTENFSAKEHTKSRDAKDVIGSISDPILVEEEVKNMANKNNKRKLSESASNNNNNNNRGRVLFKDSTGKFEYKSSAVKREKGDDEKVDANFSNNDKADYKEKYYHVDDILEKNEPSFSNRNSRQNPLSKKKSMFGLSFNFNKTKREPADNTYTSPIASRSHRNKIPKIDSQNADRFQDEVVVEISSDSEDENQSNEKDAANNEDEDDSDEFQSVNENQDSDDSEHNSESDNNSEELSEKSSNADMEDGETDNSGVIDLSDNSSSENELINDSMDTEVKNIRTGSTKVHQESVEKEHTVEQKEFVPKPEVHEDIQKSSEINDDINERNDEITTEEISKNQIDEGEEDFELYDDINFKSSGNTELKDNGSNSTENLDNIHQNQEEINAVDHKSSGLGEDDIYMKDVFNAQKTEVNDISISKDEGSVKNSTFEFGNIKRTLPKSTSMDVNELLDSLDQKGRVKGSPKRRKVGTKLIDDEKNIEYLSSGIGPEDSIHIPVNKPLPTVFSVPKVNPLSAQDLQVGTFNLNFPQPPNFPADFESKKVWEAYCNNFVQYQKEFLEYKFKVTQHQISKVSAANFQLNNLFGGYANADLCLKSLEEDHRISDQFLKAIQQNEIATKNYYLAIHNVYSKGFKRL